MSFLFKLSLFVSEEQFRELDSHYSNMGDFLKNKMFVEERILNYQHQLDERSRTEVQLEVKH